MAPASLARLARRGRLQRSPRGRLRQRLIACVPEPCPLRARPVLCPLIVSGTQATAALCHCEWCRHAHRGAGVFLLGGDLLSARLPPWHPAASLKGLQTQHLQDGPAPRPQCGERLLWATRWTVPAPRRPIAETDTAQLPERLGEEGDSAKPWGHGQSPRRSVRKGPLQLLTLQSSHRGGHCGLSPEVGAAGCWAGGPQAIETAERPADAPGGFRGRSGRVTT